MEEWRPVTIQPYNEWYEVSNLGGVRCWAKMGCQGGVLAVPRLTSMYRTKTGHLTVSMKRKPQHTTKGVHNLVLRAFVGDPPTDKHGACHINGQPDDNRVENLYWGTAAQNCQDTVRHGRTCGGTRNAQSKLTWVEVDEIRRQSYYWGLFRDLAGQYGVTKGLIGQIYTGKIWKVDDKASHRSCEKVAGVCDHPLPPGPIRQHHRKYKSSRVPV